jgi:transposase-like protein
MAKSILSADHFHDEPAALGFIEAHIWPTGPVCPRCGKRNRIGRLNGKTTRLGMCKCYACRKPFTATVGTVMESSHIPLHVWLQAIHLLCTSKKGISSNQLHRTLGVTLKSAWFLSHRIREAMTTVHVEPMGGAGMTVEADETFIGRKSASRAFQPPGVKQSVFALVQRDGGVRSFHVPNVTAANLRPIIVKHAFNDSRFQIDESPIYTRVGASFAYLGVVNHSAKEYVRGDDYTNTIEGYFSIVKRGIYGIYQHVSEAHLHRYLSEFDFRYSNRAKLGIDDVTRTDLAVAGIKGKRLTYRTTRGNRTAPTATQIGT